MRCGGSSVGRGRDRGLVGGLLGVGGLPWSFSTSYSSLNSMVPWRMLKAGTVPLKPIHLGPVSPKPFNQIISLIPNSQGYKLECQLFIRTYFWKTDGKAFSKIITE